GALFPSMREDYNKRGISVLQAFATADLGCIAYESEAMEGLIVNEDYIVEIVKPGTNERVPDGDVVEIVVTSFKKNYPLIRFGTGDMSAVLAGQSPCGRSNMRIKGWMGRADQRTKVKGMFIDPSQVADIEKTVSGLGRLRLEVVRDGDRDAMVLKCECAAQDDAVRLSVEEAVLSICKMKGEVQLVAPDSLPNDGKVIDDLRDYDS
ncbi:MAG: phenylacetate--CoA ligase family protein, partial [Hyphomicrobiales bacterium]